MLEEEPQASNDRLDYLGSLSTHPWRLTSDIQAPPETRIVEEKRYFVIHAHERIAYLDERRLMEFVLLGLGHQNAVTQVLHVNI